MRTPAVLVVLAVLAALCPSPATAAPAICDQNTPLTLIGLDTTTGTLLFSVPPLGEGTGWQVEIDATGRTARAYPDPPKGLYSGSVGPGPVLAVISCGDACVQPMQWKGGAWQPLGEPLRAPTASNLAPTYDAAGAPWLVVQGTPAADGRFPTWAYRLEGRDWIGRGPLDVLAVGQPPALPAPQRKDGVLIGTGLFSASGSPAPWVETVPTLPAARRGQIVALTGSSAAYLSADGVVYLSDDSGKKWRRSTWTPWGAPEIVGSWRQGKDYWVDLAFGNHLGGLRLVWYDRRVPSAGERILLTRLIPGGGWTTLAEAPSEIRTKGGDVLPIGHVVVPKGDTWLLLSGCVATPEGSGVVVRVLDGQELSDARFVAFSRP
ncbi:MAG TPA: hypothetical protein DD490_29755 [Acidobacteria bacterium]|nr:hypothetical protein [Acidobacteriota bacterium]